MSIKTHRTRDATKCKNGTHFRSQRRIRSQWSVRRFRAGSPEGPASVEFTFPTEGGGTSRILIPHRELRHDRALMDLFADRLPIFPSKVGTTDKSTSIYPRSRFFIQKAIRIDSRPNRFYWSRRVRDLYRNRLRRRQKTADPAIASARTASIHRCSGGARGNE